MPEQESLAKLFERPYRPIRIPKALLWLGMSWGRLGFLLGQPPLLTESRYQELTAGDFVCSGEKFQQLSRLGTMVSLDEGLRRSQEWYLSTEST